MAKRTVFADFRHYREYIELSTNCTISSYLVGSGIESSSMAKLVMSGDKALYFCGGLALIAASSMPELALGESYKLTVKDSGNPWQLDSSSKGTV